MCQISLEIIDISEIHIQYAEAWAHLATRLHLHRTAVCGKQWKVERERHGLEDFNSSEVVIR